MDNSQWHVGSRVLGCREATLEESMEAWDQLPGWCRRQNMYATFDLAAPNELKNYNEAKREGLSERTIEREFMAELRHAERLLAWEIGRHLPVRRDGPIAEWSGHHNRIPFDHMRSRRVRR